MKPSTRLSQWLFDVLGGTFIEGSTLYVSDAAVEQGRLSLPGEVSDGIIDIGGYSVTDGRVFPLVSKDDIKGAYIVYDSITITYEGTKDGRYPSIISARILCVDKTYDNAEKLADSIEDVLDGRYVPELGCIELLTRKSDYDPGRGDFLEEITISIEL